MSGTKDEYPRVRNHRLHEDIELAAANKPVVIGGILAEIEAHVPGAFGFHHFACRIPHLGFHASAPDCPDHGAVFADEELRAFEAGNGSTHLDNRRDRGFLTQAAKTDQLVVDVHCQEL